MFYYLHKIIDFKHDTLFLLIHTGHRDVQSFRCLYFAVSSVCHSNNYDFIVRKITIINQNVQIAEKKAELTDLQQQISVVEIQSQYLKKVQNYKGDDLKKYIEKIAKDELGYVGDGERIFINVAGE